MKKLTALLAGAILMMATGSAWAIPTLTLSDGAATTTVIDGTGTDSLTTHYDGLLDGLVNYIGAVGTNWTVNVSTGLINSVPGTPAMDLSSLDRTATGSGTLSISFSDLITSAWTGPGAATAAGGTLLPGTGNSATFETKINGTSYSTMSFASPMVAFSGEDAFSYTPTGSDFIQMIATINHTGKGSSSFDYALNPVPEPGTMVLLGFGMLGLAIYGKRRMNNNQA